MSISNITPPASTPERSSAPPHRIWIVTYQGDECISWTEAFATRELAEAHFKAVLVGLWAEHEITDPFPGDPEDAIYVLVDDHGEDDLWIVIEELEVRTSVELSGDRVRGYDVHGALEFPVVSETKDVG